MKVSVALCTYNGAPYIAEQLDSILNQTVIPDEIIICDDISGDETLKIITQYQEKYSQIKIFLNDNNLGFIKNFEKAIQLCTQDIIIISDQDDTWEHNKVEEIIKYFEENAQYDGVFHDLRLIGEEVGSTHYLAWKNIDYQSIINSIQNNVLFLDLMKKGSFILGCALAIRQKSLEKHQLKNFTFAHDYYIALKLSSQDKLGFIPKALSTYRLHEKQVYGLRYQPNKNKETLSEKDEYFRAHVWSNLKVVEKYQELNPHQDVKQTKYYSNFILERNSYLKRLNFFERKIYIAKCVKHKYLDLKTIDLIIL